MRGNHQHHLGPLGKAFEGLRNGTPEHLGVSDALSQPYGGEIVNIPVWSEMQEGNLSLSFPGVFW